MSRNKGKKKVLQGLQIMIMVQAAINGLITHIIIPYNHSEQRSISDKMQARGLMLISGDLLGTETRIRYKICYSKNLEFEKDLCGFYLDIAFLL